MNHNISELKDTMIDGKDVFYSLNPSEISSYDYKGNKFFPAVTHQELGFRIPYSDNYKNDIARIVMSVLPEYDAIVWRVIPEVTYFKYKLPIRISFTDWYGPGIPEADVISYLDVADKETPDFVKFYSRFSLSKDGKQVKLKTDIGENHD